MDVATQGIGVTSGMDESMAGRFAAQSLSELRLLFLFTSSPAKGRKSYNTISKVKVRL